MFLDAGLCSFFTILCVPSVHDARGGAKVRVVEVGTGQLRRRFASVVLKLRRLQSLRERTMVEIGRMEAAVEPHPLEYDRDLLRLRHRLVTIDERSIRLRVRRKRLQKALHTSTISFLRNAASTVVCDAAYITQRKYYCLFCVVCCL